MGKLGRPVVKLLARCACGQVEVSWSGEVRAMLLCSCLDCQQASGSGHTAVAVAHAGDVTVTGAVKSFARPAASGAEFIRHFCPECGTPLHARSSRAKGMLMLPVGLFSGADLGWFAPQQLIFARSHQSCDRVADHLPRHQQYREDQA